MGRRKAAENCTILPWVSAKADNKEKKFLQIGVTLFENEAFQSLTPPQKIVYLAMCLDAGGSREFTFSKERFSHFGIPPSTARDAIEVLIQKGFITREFSGKLAHTKSLFRFSLDWKLKK